MTELDDAMVRLRAAERERRAAIDELIRLGAIRSHVLVGDLGVGTRRVGSLVEASDGRLVAEG